MHFIALMVLLMLGRYRSRPDWAGQLASRKLVPASGFAWLVLLLGLLVAEYLLLSSNGLFWSAVILLLQVTLLFFLLPHWAAFDLTGDYYQDWCRGDYQAAFLDLSQKFSLAQTDGLDSCRGVHYAVCQHYLNLSLTGFFTLLFWFFLLGIPGVFLGLWACGVRHTGSRDSRLLVLARPLTWLPAQALGFTFFVVGNGRGAADYLRFPNNSGDQQWLLSLALAAVGDKHFSQGCVGSLVDEEFRHHAADELKALVVLVRRSAVLWLLLFGLLTMVGFEAPLY